MQKFLLLKKFEGSLVTDFGISKNTLRFYRSDLNHFLNWFAGKLKLAGIFIENFEETLNYLNSHQAQEYKDYLIASLSPVKTLNRRLATLRHLDRFLISNNLIDQSFMANIFNIGKPKFGRQAQKHPIISDFEKHLKDKNISKNTIKNYLSDIKHFMLWLDRYYSN